MKTVKLSVLLVFCLIFASCGKAETVTANNVVEDNLSSKKDVDSASVTVEEDEEVMFYSLDDMSVDDIVEECIYYLDLVPHIGETQADYMKKFKNLPSDFEAKGTYYSFFYDDEILKNHDVLRAAGTTSFTEQMDGTIGAPLFGEAKMEVSIAIRDYNKAVEVYNKLINKTFIVGTELEDNREGIYWTCYSYDKKTEHKYEIASMNKADNTYFILACNYLEIN